MLTGLAALLDSWDVYKTPHPCLLPSFLSFLTLILITSFIPFINSPFQPCTLPVSTFSPGTTWVPKNRTLISFKTSRLTNRVMRI